MKRLKTALHLVPEPTDTESLTLRLSVTLYNTEPGFEEIRSNVDFVELSSSMNYGVTRKNHFATFLIKKSKEARRMCMYEELESGITKYLRMYPRPYRSLK